MRARLTILVLMALPLAGVDLAVKAALPDDAALVHQRSPAWIALSLALLALLALLARLPSRLLAATSGLLAAGILGNLAWAATHGGRVANPFVAGDVAFNLADCLFVAGLLLETAAAMRLAVRYRHLLPQSTIPVRIVRRLRTVRSRCRLAAATRSSTSGSGIPRTSHDRRPGGSSRTAGEQLRRLTRIRPDRYAAASGHTVSARRNPAGATRSVSLTRAAPDSGPPAHVRRRSSAGTNPRVVPDARPGGGGTVVGPTEAS